MSALVHIGSYTFTVARLLAIGGTAQLALFALISIISRSPLPKSGMRFTERNLLGSALVFLVMWLAGFNAPALVRTLPKTPSTQSSVLPRTNNAASCATITRDMTAAQVQKRLGRPDERRSDEDTRGPGTMIWIYRDSRCAVHLFDDKVEFIE